jgi:transposase
MISLLQRAEIRRLFYAEHWSVGTIADALGVHHETVSRALNRARVHSGLQIRPSELDPYKGFIATTLEQYPRLRATRVHAMLRERGYPGSAVQVRRYVRSVRPAARAEAFFRLDTLVGEQGQVDWGHFGAIQIGAARRVLPWTRNARACSRCPRIRLRATSSTRSTPARPPTCASTATTTRFPTR